MLRPWIISAIFLLFGSPGPSLAEPQTLVEVCMAQQEADGGAPDSCIGVSVRSCSERAVSTADQVACIEFEAMFWSDRLKIVFDQLLKHYEAEDAEYESLRAVAPIFQNTQEVWETWRDAKCGFAYGEYRGGSMGVAASFYCQMQMTAERALEIEALLADIAP